MSEVGQITTTVSTKGQVILPKSIRQARSWNAGTRLVVENGPDGVMLKAAPCFPETSPEHVFGCLPYKGKPKSVAEMEEAILAEAKKMYASS